MNKEEIYVRINEIFADAFDRDDLNIVENTTAKDVEGWDSLMHISIIEMIEDEFEIKFEMEEITHLKTVGDIVQIIEKKAK